jgi:hypothetical protein
MSIASQQEASVMEMMRITGSDRGTCTFYLDSSDYHLDKAMSLYKDMMQDR